MDAKEKEEAKKEGAQPSSGGEEEKSFEERRKEILKEADEGVKKIKVKEKHELAVVAAKMKKDAAKRKEMRKAGAPSTKNIDKSHFVERCETPARLRLGLAESSPPAAPRVQLDDDQISTRTPHWPTG